MASAAKIVASPNRRSLIAKVHIAAQDLALTEDTRRELMHRVTGFRSSADCTEAQLVAVLDEYRRLGWTPKVQAAGRRRRGAAPAAARPGRRPANTPIAKKCRAMWISLHQLGVVQDASEMALEAFAKRQLGVEALQWADPGQAFRLVEGLKAMANRAGWDQDVGDLRGEEAAKLLKRRLQALLEARQ